MNALAKKLPGVAAAVTVAGGAAGAASLLPSEWHVSAIPLSIALGAAAGNAAPALRDRLKPGVSMCASTVLRVGVVCVGAKLSAAQVFALGWTTIPAAAAAVTVGITTIPAIASYAGLPPRLGSLIAAGTSVCGVTAIGAVAPAIAATQAEVAVAVGNVVAYGTAAMLCYPHLAARLFPAGDSQHIGLFLGLGVHDTAQVMGAAASYAEQYSDAAVVTCAAVAKLTRNVSLAAVVPLMAAKHGAAGAAAGFSTRALAAAVPTFVLGFLGMSLLRTLGDLQLSRGGAALGVLDAKQWKQGAEWVGNELGTKILLGTAMAGVGLSVQASAFKGVGYRP
eukprot:CAMPEP_0173396494 /NCGR_PEP_ID=MMETSP1356-20130122/35630_1 /TAXON_ID=77927 ORGANISM="Hemiselmis virescens, Strain PCC157" /NCGR_SAMPLE_ID=MMETSP1356 /ASSEMBLY_ACC=CAM_ASM_000847 /LENGTH=335 /DNA_ID=CAMNT_0014355549 /DNA_START=165 /DNA_END=1168 /DNA_ORIENTATION=+